MITMKVNCEKLKTSIKKLSSLNLKDNGFKEFLRLNEFSEEDIDKFFNYLSEKLLDRNWTSHIAEEFIQFLLLIVAKAIPVSVDILDFVDYQNKCIVLSNLMHLNLNVLEYALKFFTNKPAPFVYVGSEENNQEKKRKLSISVQKPSDKDIIKCCYNLLIANTTFFRDIWDWSFFLEKYFYEGTYDQQIYCNKIVSVLTDMTESQLSMLNRNIPPGFLEDFDEIENSNPFLKTDESSKLNSAENDKVSEYKCSNEITVNVEEVLLPVYNLENYNHYKLFCKKDIIKVDSTRRNLRNIAIGISSGKAICVCGPVGCGKTTLVEYLAKKTGHVYVANKIYNNKCGQKNEKQLVMENISESTNILKEIKRKNVLRLRNDDDINNVIDKQDLNQNFIHRNGFLRIQLGDQTDSKMLLGQYHCTDIPGEFAWSPGVLTQAVMNGLWLLLEDIDLATQDTFTILSTMLQTKSLSVPGFKDVIKIAPGFQLFVSLRTGGSSRYAQKSYVSLLNKYLYTVNIIPLSKEELSNIVSESYFNLKDIAPRMVDMYLNFIDENLTTEFLNSSSSVWQSTTERLVSTRDFIKLCQRCDPTFSKTSAECAFFIFQNAVDLFCSHLQEGSVKLKFITTVGSKLGINPSRCEHYANEYKPDVCRNDFSIKIGRIELYKNSKIHSKRGVKEAMFNKKRLKVNENLEKEISVVTKVGNMQSDLFAFTRISVCLLEKVAVCIDQNEPVLLVGETGVGKTSSINYLANQTNHKLIVVNMNNQSDVSDLIGGFRPVDLSYVMMPLRVEFENLFRKTFNELKNEKFLSNISICYNQGNFDIIIKLILKIAESVFEKSKINQNNTAQKNLEEWIILQKKVKRLYSQLQKSANISFAFIPGALVNCIQNGDWILLDEINLATAETLECLSTILEPSGSIILLERGDFSPIERHTDFRIFACMNPNTDIGKKDLPIGIRNRFTEFYVDELTTDYDLTLLVNDYLQDTGIKKVKISSIVKLYKKLRSLAHLELNDGLGNRPVYSLRNLCRALKICSKNLCGSIERNLYESFCLSFLTQLDIISHKVVLSLIKEYMLEKHVNAVLSQHIPKPGEHFLNFEGYWIEKGKKTILECDYYILTESVQQNLKDLARVISIGKLPILLQGPTSAGKTSLIEYIAKKSGNLCLRVNNHEHTDLQEYVGTYVSDENGKLSFKEGVLVQAMRHGFWIILDELNLASSDILEALNRVLDDNRELFIPETQAIVKAHKNFMLFATQNPPGLYGGRKTLSRAFKNRFIELHFSDIPSSELELILEKRCFIPKSYSQKMVKCMNELQVNRKTTSKSNFTLRDLFRWGNRYTYANKKLLNDNSYDWNQHLVDEGYLVLSGKVRTEVEETIIRDALKKHFKKFVDTKNLFDYSNSTSMVTKNILHNLHGFKIRNDIIWTHNMKRMAVLTAKSLEFNEPVLLVGPTGSGKTTICQILAEISGSNLRILNCHMHTEGADFLGGLRPHRNAVVNEDNHDDKHDRKNLSIQENEKQLFEWVDGPLVKSMQDGSYFMVDEISLAEDSVLERLNSVLEPERTLLLAEKGVSESNFDCKMCENKSDEFFIQAKDNFKFLATMNPGGDFGKKELSPALRNRFTEIWCKPSIDFNDLEQIATNMFNVSTKLDRKIHEQIANVLIKVVFYIKEKVEKFKFSVRDIITWVLYIVKNSKNENLEEIIYHKPDILVFGLETVFLDSLEMLSQDSLECCDEIRESIINFLIQQICNILKVNTEVIKRKRDYFIEFNENIFGISPFYIKVNKNLLIKQNNFFFEAPTTFQNLFRLLSALSLEKAILLEGPPGVGKTSIVENLAKHIGYKVVRINLCEHTDLADLFGTDLPVEENLFNLKCDQFNDNHLSQKLQPGTFKWHNGPLLSALLDENVWILLDELNLAPQSVLEGLNAILDHRGEVFIPELNKIFKIGEGTKIFACQNPLRQGGGRKGLPQSFLNRFTKVYLRKLNVDDLLHVINNKYKDNFSEIKNYFEKYLNSSNGEIINFFDVLQLKDTNGKDFSNLILNYSEFDFNLSNKMVKFSEKLAIGVTKFEFGYQGGPYEINLRDIIRWCDSLFDKNIGFIIRKETDFNSVENLILDIKDFLLVLYERMKLVYSQRMRSDQDRIFINNEFSQEFNCDVEKLNALSNDIGIYFTESEVYLNDIIIKRDTYCLENTNQYKKSGKEYPLILSQQKELLKNLAECVHIEKPVLLCGPADSGKTKVVDLLSDISNKPCIFDNIDDSVTGSFQQIDFNRHFEEISSQIEWEMLKFLQNEFLKKNLNKSKSSFLNACKLLKIWNSYTKIDSINKVESFQDVVDAVSTFIKRIDSLKKVIQCLEEFALEEECNVNRTTKYLKLYLTTLNKLKNLIEKSETLNSGGYFEWIDSKIVKCLKSGGYICLEHANLCSSAVLDRLNSVFEPEGQLLISEKGIAIGHDAEMVVKHKNFRAFLSIDPKNGELSRAMRNRCIEIGLKKDSYSISDLKKIIFSNGIVKSNCIEAVLYLYINVKNLTDLNNFNISHLIQLTFLMFAYNRIGFDDFTSIYVAGMDIFVHSSKTDLMGYGLDFYKNKMKEIICEASDIVKNRKNKKINLKNAILTSKNLNCLSLIKMQLQPFSILLKNYENDESAIDDLKFLFDEFDLLEFLNYELLLKFYIFTIYQCSKQSDIKYRYYVIEKLLNKHDRTLPGKVKEILLKLNDNLLIAFRNQIIRFEGRNLISSDLPWNMKFFPRIRIYKELADIYTKQEFESKTSACFMYENLVRELPKEEEINLKRNQLTAYSYSYGVHVKLIIDKTNNEFLKNLYVFTKELRTLLKKSAEHIDNKVESFVDITLNLLWLGRYGKVSNFTLFDKNDEANQELLNQLYLHFKWIEKVIIKPIQITYKDTLRDFSDSYCLLANYLEKSDLNVNVLKKYYVKLMTNFSASKSLEKMQYEHVCIKLDHLINLLPFYGKFDVNMILKKFHVINCEEYKKAKSLLLNKEYDEFINEIRVESDAFNERDKIKKSKIEDILIEFRKNQLQFMYVIDEIDFETLNSSVQYINSIISNDNYNIDDINLDLFDIEILPLKEYYLNNIFVHINPNNSWVLNKSYIESIPSLKLRDMKLFKVLNSSEYRNFNKMWFNLFNCINKGEHLSALFNSGKELLKRSDYRKYSTFDLKILNSIKSYKLSNLKLKFNCCFELMRMTEINCELNYSGPYLINILNKLLLSINGDLRETAIKELPKWQNQLKQINELLWFNSNLIDMSQIVIKDFQLAIFYGKKLLLEIEFVFNEIESRIPKETFNQRYEVFIDVTKNLQQNIDSFEKIDTHLICEYTLNDLTNLEQKTALIYSLIGIIQLQLITFLPLVDPIEKNYLKKQYIDEDITNLKSLFNTYKIMSKAMDYKSFGEEYRSIINEKLETLTNKKQKYLQKNSEKRPEAHLYSKMVKDLAHYLSVNGNLNQLMAIVSKAIKCFNSNSDKFEMQQELKECIKIINVWILNSQQFLQQILRNYPYYREDLLYPMECAINIVRYGFESIKKNLVQLNCSLKFEIENTDLDIEDLYKILEFLVDYPHQDLLSKKLQDNLFKILKRINPNEYEILFVRILKFKISEIQNAANMALEVNTKLFFDYSNTLESINKIWKNQEDLKRKQQIEEESLYVMKVKCENENEEEEELKSIQELFPTTINEDFSEFVETNSNSLENYKTKIQTNAKNQEHDKNLIIDENQFNFVVKNFIETFCFAQQTSVSSETTILENFSEKLKIFQTIFDVYKPALNEVFDCKLFNTFRLIIKLHHEQINKTSKTSSDKDIIYNIYKNSNIPEINPCVPLLEEIMKRVNEQLDLYPEHAVLIDIVKISRRINNFPMTSPIVRFNTGFQLLRQKIAQWNEVAHKHNHMQDLEVRIAEFVQRWTKLELQFWKNCLNDVREKIERSSFKYWFFIYNSLHEFLTSMMEYEENKSLVESSETNLNNITEVLKQFVESANYGDFSIRLMLLKSFEFYLNLSIQYQNGLNLPKEKLISLIYNVRLYYEQFINQIDGFKKNLLTAVEKKLKELIKIESYNKDLSYFAMKNDIAKVHRNLNKFAKEYEHGLKESITKVFVYKEENMSDLSTNNDKGGKCLRNDPKIKYYMIDVKHFISSQVSKNIKYDNNDEAISNSSSVILNRFEKLYLTSRNVCKELILKINYPNLTSNLEGILSNYFETYEYLHNLNVDCTQEKKKQIAQNKHFIQQKRKALSDVFKTLTILGLNYRTGLTEVSIKSELTNLNIKPFSFDKFLLDLSKSKTLNQNFVYLNDNLNLYYAKCTYKLNILQNILQNPNAELGPSNIDRIKGFSVDMFLFVQNQRKLLSSSVNVFCEIKKNIYKLNQLVYCCQQNDFDELKLNFLELENSLINLKEVFLKITVFFKQFKILLETIPLEKSNNNVFEHHEELTKNSDRYEKILNCCEKILQIAKTSIIKLKNLSTMEPLNYEAVKELLKNKENCIKIISDLHSELTVSDRYSPMKNSLIKLQNSIFELDNKNIVETQSTVEIDVNSISAEIDNILHMALISIQNLFKKYNTESTLKDQNKDKLNVIGESEIYNNHLKEKLYKDMVTDFNELNMEKISLKMENVYVAIKHLNYKTEVIKKIFSLIPILDQYRLLGCYYIFQQFGAHKVTIKILYVMLSAFIELSSKGFCSPPDLIQDVEGQQQQHNRKDEGGGFSEDHTTGNEKDVSDQIENEDQLDDAKRPEDRKNEKDDKDKNCKEEKGIEMNDNFDAELQDLEKDQEEDDISENDDDENDFDKEMGNTEKGADKLDEQIWGSDNEEPNEDTNEVSDDETGRGGEDENDSHNDLDSSKDIPKSNNGKNQDQLDSVDEDKESKGKKEKPNNIDNMPEPECDDEQINPYHNKLEEPPEPEEMQLDDDVNLDEGFDKDKEQSNNLENPFDIDKMKETMELDEQHEENTNEEKAENNMSNNEDDSDEDYENLKRDLNEDNEDKNNTDCIEENEEGDLIEDDNKAANDGNNKDDKISEHEQNENELYEESKDNTSKENNLQSNDTECKSSNDQVKNPQDNNIKQDQELDDQETGEESKGIGQASNEKADMGHQSVIETKELNSVEKNINKKETKQKNKLQETDLNRTLGERDENTIKTLKTIEKSKTDDDKVSDEECNPEEVMKSDEYQHIKEPEKSKVTALDTATEEQSKQYQQSTDKEENDEEIDDSIQNKDNINEENLDEEFSSVQDEVTEIKPEKNKRKSENPKSNDMNEELQQKIIEEKMEIDGDEIETLQPLRGSETTAHCMKENLCTQSAQEEDESETLQMRKVYYEKLGNIQKNQPQAKDFEVWQSVSSMMVSNARDLCEQLRLILEPTKCTKLKGDYKTGRRINMKKIIPFIASQFRKDKIWLRRTKPSQRDYKITIAIDDSKSMHHNNSKEITLKAISLASQALTLLESGKLNILSFGESPQIILSHSDQFDGPKLVSSLNFDQNQSKIAELLDFIRILNIEEGNSSSDNRFFENLLLILSDGRNIFSEGEQKVKNSVKLAKLQRIFMVYIIIDNPENKHSILDIRVPSFSLDKKLISMKSYLDTFPFPYYVIVRNLDQLPLVLSEAMRQWFELVNSDQ